MTRRRWLIVAVATAALALTGAVWLLTTRDDDKAADAGVAAGEQLLREHQLREQQARNDRLERKLRKLKRRSRHESSSATSAGAAGAGFAKLASQLSGSVGVAYGPPGSSGKATVLGDWSSGPAWSSIKVPIAVATIRKGTGSDQQRRLAITQSDNAAAEALWSSLGSPAQAGAATESVLAAAGDDQTSVETSRVRQGFTSFGQTDWSLSDAQRFVAGLQCVSGSKPVLSLMSQIASDQRWGLGQAGTNQRFKGGWGPDTSGAYLVRQIGLIDVKGGTLAVAIAAKPADGSFETGKRQLDTLADWVAAHAEGAGSPDC